MRISRFILLLLALSCFVFAVASCRRGEKKEKMPDEEPLLLLDEGPGEALAGHAEGADNSRCHVCHMNFAFDKFSIEHARADIGCETCHGPSDAHCSDEDNITPPDKMYAKDKINPACLECHGDTIKKTPKHKAVLAGALKKVCTDCHGKHRVNHRTRRWNKDTGELLSDDKVRMLTDDMLKEE